MLVAFRMLATPAPPSSAVNLAGVYGLKSLPPKHFPTREVLANLSVIRS